MNTLKQCLVLNKRWRKQVEPNEVNGNEGNHQYRMCISVEKN